MSSPSTLPVTLSPPDTVSLRSRLLAPSTASTGMFITSAIDVDVKYPNPRTVVMAGNGGGGGDRLREEKGERINGVSGLELIETECKRYGAKRAF
ncbi:hypothetical protein E3N88_11515 [Mikania micrantha]|uniref:Uncharacterized protein n=1 Tax=Mikania micrantha TaxID=192012 RepID=A0A5N6PFM6_9ASTR|nr:hypothetical protein E3N88_11515 [Mikania micrantha]